MTRNAAWIIAGAIVLGFALHATIPLIVVPLHHSPLYAGYIQGEVWVRESPSSVAHEKCNGFRVECYESFVVIYVDCKKEPTWTGDYVLTIPWHKIENMTLMPPGCGA